MTIVPLQYFGIGDIIFSQTLVRDIAKGNSILWPVMPEFVEGLSRAYPDITFVDYTTTTFDFNTKIDVVRDDHRLLPIRWADHILKLPAHRCMGAKYDLYGMDYTNWKEKAVPRVDMHRSVDLFNKLGLNLGDSFNLINNTFRSDANSRLDIQVNNGLRNVEMKPTSGYSLFDWYFTMTQATEIHSVSTSLFYLTEICELKAELHLYPRPEDPGFRHINYLFTKPYTLHTINDCKRNSR